MITIFTPTYNRAYIIERLYKSLLKQTSKDFEWLIVDDGSTDETEEKIKKWISEKKILIRYYKQENQGKMIAHNKGVQKAKGELFVCVDSDDYVSEDAVKTIIKVWQDIDKEKCTGIVSLKVKEDKKPVGTYMPSNVTYATLIDLYEKYQFHGDAMLTYKTEILKRYEFPKVKGEKFIPETYLYDKIDLNGKLYLLNCGLYICEYLPDGYTSNVSNMIINNPNGYILYAEQRMKLAKRYKTKIKSTAQYVLGNWLANNKHYIKTSINPLLTIVSIPFAYIIYLKRYKKLKEKNFGK